MTVDLIIKMFEAEYLFECERRKEKARTIPTKLYATFFSEGQQEILNIANPLKRTSTISIVAGTSEYNMPVDFGQLISADISGVDFTEEYEIYFSGDSAGETANLHKLKLAVSPTSAYTLTIWYKPNLNYYIAGGDVAQQWGSFTSSSTAFSGDFKLPDIYAQPLKYFLMYKVLGDFPYYEKFRMLIKEVSKGNGKFNFENDYKLGGID